MTYIESSYKPAVDPANVIEFAPATIDKRTDSTPLTRLGTSFMDFPVEGSTDPWTLRYEETVYVIEGRVTIDVIAQGESEYLTVTGGPGDLIALPELATVRYAGTAGTRLLLSITPVNWRESLDKTPTKVGDE